MSQTKEWGILPAQTLARELFVRSRLEGHYVDKTHALEKHLRAPADATVYTCPEDALAFAEGSGCDALAVAIGTAHGVYKETPRLDLDCLHRIADACPLPLVLHGGSGLSDEDFRACVAGGISKINIFTHNNLAAARAVWEHYTPETGAFELMPWITEAVKRETMHHIRVFGSDGKA